MIKVIIFDIDGVLITNKRRFSSTLAKEYNISLKKTLPFFEGVFQDCLIGKKDLKEVLLPYLKSWNWTKGVNKFLDIWFEFESKIDNRLIKYIQKLRDKKILCSLATNNEKYRFQYIIDKIGFEKSFDKVYASAHLGSKKPDIEFFSKIFNDLNNIKKDEILFIDDSIENIEGAKKFGINAELYTSFEDFKEKIKKYLA